MQTKKQIKKRIRMLREDKAMARDRCLKFLRCRVYAQATAQSTVVACADSMIEVLKWVLGEDAATENKS